MPSAREALPPLTVRISYHNTLRSAVGHTEELIRLPANASLLDLLHRLGELHGSRLSTLLFDADGTVVTHLVVFRNQKLVPQDRYGLDLDGGDEFMLFPAVSGG